MDLIKATTEKKCVVFKKQCSEDLPYSLQWYLETSAIIKQQNNRKLHIICVPLKNKKLKNGKMHP